MSMVPTQDNTHPMGCSHSTLIPRLLLGLAVVALPSTAPAGIFDFLKKDRDDDVEIIETHHASNCRCRTRCNHPKHPQKQHTTPQTTPQTTYRPTPRPTPRPQPQTYYPTPQPTPQQTRRYTVPQIAAQPTAPILRNAPPAPPTYRYAIKPTPAIVYQPAPTYRTGPQTIYQREAVIGRVPVTTWQTQWVDQGGYRMVWVSRPVLRQVPRTSYQSVRGYRVVPYQRVNPLAGVPVHQPTPQPTARPVPNPLDAQPVSSRPAANQSLKPTTAHRVFQARGRLGR